MANDRCVSQTMRQLFEREPKQAVDFRTFEAITIACDLFKEDV